MHETLAVEVSGLLPFKSVIYITGPKTIKILSSMVNNTGDVEGVKTMGIVKSVLADTPGKKKVDDVFIVIIRPPYSETGEDSAYLLLAGGRMLPSMVLNMLAKAGARITTQEAILKSAYLSGKIDLMRVHGYLEMMHARTEKGFGIAYKRYEGYLSDKIIDMANSLKRIALLIKDDMEERERSMHVRRMKGILGTLKFMLAQGVKGMVYIEGLEVAIVGRPNVGKSTLFNKLVGKESSIVTPMPGTTRDIISEIVDIEGVPLKFHDTAGFRETEELVEKIGVERAKEIASLSHFVLFVLDASSGLKDEDVRLWELLKGERITIFNKIDEGFNVDSFLTLSELSKYPQVNLSSKTGEGFNNLISAIKQEIHKYFHISEEFALTQREASGIRLATEAISSAVTYMEEKKEAAKIKAKLNNAVATLNELVGVEHRASMLFNSAIKDFVK